MPQKIQVLEFLVSELSVILGIAPGRIQSDTRLNDLALSDAHLEELARLLTSRFEAPLATSQIRNCSTIRDLVALVISETTAPAAPLDVDEGIDNVRGRSTDAANIDAEYTVWYATNREPVSGGDWQNYSAGRSDRIRYGRCTVFVPASHNLGSLDSSLWKRITRSSDVMRILSSRELVEADFWSGVSVHPAIHSGAPRQAMVFVHGYNVSFENAALRAAQIGFDLSLNGPMGFFSWPSQGALTGYLTDGDAVAFSESHIAKFLVDFAEKSGAEQVHLVVHSMGNRGVVRAAQQMVEAVRGSTAVPFSQIVLAAPDVDADIFGQLYGSLAALAKRTTLYVSSRDLAVGLSKYLHQFDRAGFAPPVFVAKGIDTVNVTNVDLSVLGHGYVAATRDVLADVHKLITENSPPSARFGLRQCASSGGIIYWEFKE